jgi:hypothetical protein
MSVENPGGKRLWRGFYVCECVTLIYPIMEARMEAAGCFTDPAAYQGSYNGGGVAASAGTHDGGGTSDHNQDNWDQLTIQRECGAAAWARTPAEGFDYHTHSVLIGCPHLSSGAADQVSDYKSGRNGLANNGPDTGPDVPYITWQDAYHKYSGTTGGILGMSTVDKWSRSGDRVIKADGAWHLVLIDDEDNSSLFFGPGTFIVFAGISLTGLSFNSNPVQFRFVTVDDKDPDKVISTYPIQEIFGSGGTTMGSISFVNSIGDGTRLRLQVNAPQQITITSVTSRCLHD